jgi:lysophospholipase L1-like esterase
MHTKLAGLERRPELAIIYAGHNEFHSRFDWAHGAYHYLDQTPPIEESLRSRIAGVSPLFRLIGEAAEKLTVSVPPQRIVTRQIVDVPVYTAAQYALRRNDFHKRLGAIVTYLEWIGAQVVLVIPPGNDIGFEPNRSFLPEETPLAEREEFAKAFLAARRLEAVNPERAGEAYRRLLERQPGFSEAHFRLARLLDRSGRWDEAFHHYVAARDLDGLPMRLPSDFQQAYRDVAAKHPRAILVDGPAEIHARADHGLSDDNFFSDGMHPSLNGYTVLADAILRRLNQEHALGWSAPIAQPIVTPAQCAQRFEMDGPRWQEIAGYSAWFYNRTAFARHEPAERAAKAKTYAAAARAIAAGTPADAVGVPGLGARTRPFRSDPLSFPGIASGLAARPAP